MNSKERILKTLNHEEPDRVPIFEMGVNNAAAEYFLGRKTFIYAFGISWKTGIDVLMRDKNEYKKLVENSFQDSLELNYKVGLDNVLIATQGFSYPVEVGLNFTGLAEIYDVEIKKVSEDNYKIISKDPDAPGFWTTCRYVHGSETWEMISDSIKENGREEFLRYLEYLENKDLSKIPEQLEIGLEALKKAIDTNNKKYNLFVLGLSDIEYPTFLPFHDIFLEYMAIDEELVKRYMSATNKGMLAMCKLQLEAGVDGILASNDWCYGGGSMMSPTHFKEYLAPHLKALVDLTHSYNKKFIKHLDGNTYGILDTIVNYCGIDAYHSIEPPAGMDIERVKDLYGDKITVVGNIDCADILSNWTPDQIKEEVKRIIKAISPGGGHIFSSSNIVHNGVPLENVFAYFDAVKEYGTYPIDL